MTRQEIVTLFDFDTWATERTVESVSSLAEGTYLEDLKSSHGGIHGTLVHIYSANMVWLQRWKGGLPSTHVSVDDIPSLASLKARRAEYMVELDDFLANLTEARLSAALAYQDLKGNKHSEPLFQQMQHVVNHSSYHRGQIVTMLRQVGAKPVATDLIAFYRMKPGAH
jgi:uncharacterized damage-inducible protein DinB